MPAWISEAVIQHPDRTRVSCLAETAPCTQQAHLLPGPQTPAVLGGMDGRVCESEFDHISVCGQGSPLKHQDLPARPGQRLTPSPHPTTHTPVTFYT